MVLIYSVFGERRPSHLEAADHLRLALTYCELGGALSVNFLLTVCLCMFQRLTSIIGIIIIISEISVE